MWRACVDFVCNESRKQKAFEPDLNREEDKLEGITYKMFQNRTLKQRKLKNFLDEREILEFAKNESCGILKIVLCFGTE